ncbi:MAG TPA: RING finger protein [Ignavibacteria bacterium]
MTEINIENKSNKKNKCPYCQSFIKQEADTIFCSNCGTPHHIECWEENGGCTTYGCKENPVMQNKQEESTVIRGIDVGNKTIEELRETLQKENVIAQGEIECKYCSKKIDSNSKYCKHCGKKQADETTSTAFETEYKNRYKENVSIKRKSNFLTAGSITFLSIFIIIVLVFSYKLINENLVGEKAKVKELIKIWNDSYQDKNIEKMKQILDKDYLYYDKNDKTADASQRLKLMSAFFKSNKYKNCIILNVKTEPDSVSAYHLFLTFDQLFIYENETKTEKRSFKLYRGEDSKLKIFREYAQSEK